MNKKLLKELLKKNGYKVLDITLCENNEFAIVTVKDVFEGGNFFRQYFFNKYDLESTFTNRYGIECVKVNYCIFGIEKTFQGMIML